MKYPHIYLPQGKLTWFARKSIPADVRERIGKGPTFSASTGKQGAREAAAVASGLVLEWSRKIEDARKGIEREDQSDLARLAEEYRKFRGKPLDAAGAAIVLDVLRFGMTRFGGASLDAVDAALSDGASIASVTTVAGPKAAQAASKINETLGLATPFLTHLEDWLATLENRKGGVGNEKTLGQRVQAIKEFAAAVSVPMEALSGRDVQGWLDAMTNKKNGKPTDAKTKARKLSDIRPYWKWLQSNDHVSNDSNPFDNRVVSNGFTDVEEQEREVQSYPLADVPKLWERAEMETDSILADVTRLAAYSGMRLGEIMNLKAASLVNDGGVRSIAIVGTKRKTRASKRTFPIHSKIKDVIERLEKAAGGGFLIPSDAKRREGAMSKRFSRMKSRMNYDERYTFHSLRHTVIGMMRDAGVPLEVRNRIVGHEDALGHGNSENFDKKTNTGTIYGGMAGLSKLEIMEKVLVYPES